MKTSKKYEKEYEKLLKMRKEYEEKIKESTGIEINQIILLEEKLTILRGRHNEMNSTENKIKELEEERNYVNKLTKMGWREESEFPLNKRITCSLCGNKFTAYVTKSKNRYYRCQGYKKKICVAKSVRADFIENIVKNAYFTALKDTGISIYEKFHKWIFNTMIKDMFTELKDLSFSLESIDLLKKTFNKKIIEFEEYINLPSEKKQDFAESTLWLFYELHYLKMIKFDVLKNEGEIIFNVGDEEKKIFFVV